MTLPLRVLHLCAGNLYGGVERIVAACASSRPLCPEMSPAFAVCFDGRLSRELDALGVRCARLGGVRASRPWSVLAARHALHALLQSDRPNAVVCHSAWIYAIAAPVVRRSRATLVLWLHDTVSGGTWVERCAKRSTPDLVVSNSAFTDRTVRKLYGAVPRAIVYAPLPPPSAAAAAGRREMRAAFGVDGSAPVVLIASRFEEWKGHRALVGALAAIREPWHLWIAGRPQRSGEAAYERTLHALVASLGIGERVRFLGERTDMAEVFAAADLHCQPNTAPESFGLAFVEAMYAGLPVVATAAGGVLEIVTPSTGVLVPEEDGPALERALRDLILDPSARATLGSAGPARARELCDPALQLARLSRLLTAGGAVQVAV